MATIQRFEEIEAWQTARQLTQLVYDLSNQESFARDYALRDQMRRASIGIMSNIAEGFESRTRPLFVQFLGVAKGSAGELRAQSYVAFDAGYLSEEQFNQLSGLAARCSRQLSRFIQHLQNDALNRIYEESADYDA